MTSLPPYKNLFINFLFTSGILIAIIFCILEGKPYFIAKKEKEAVPLSSGIEHYKVSTKGGETIGIKNSQFAASAESLYNTPPSIKIQKLVNIYELEEENKVASKEELPDEIIGGILTNPIFKGHYLQLGIFENKQAAQKTIEYASQNSLIKEGSFTPYTETRYYKGKPYYLAQIGIFSAPEDALNFCEKLQKSGVNCLLVK